MKQRNNDKTKNNETNNKKKGKDEHSAGGRATAVGRKTATWEIFVRATSRMDRVPPACAKSGVEFSESVPRYV